jgi:hypothetical protein
MRRWSLLQAEFCLAEVDLGSACMKSRQLTAAEQRNRWLPQTTCADRTAGSSGDLLPPSPPSKKATARQNHSGRTSADDPTGNIENDVTRCVSALSRWPPSSELSL